VAGELTMHSDIDLLIITRRDLGDDEHDLLLNETYPLYLECGRQITPHFVSKMRLAHPENEKTRGFLDRMEADAGTPWTPATAE
jgi:hypothetical protein